MKNKTFKKIVISISIVALLVVISFLVIRFISKDKTDNAPSQQPVQEVNQETNDQVVNTPPILKLDFESDPEYIPNCIVIQNKWNDITFDRSNSTTAEIVMAGPNKETLFNHLHSPKVGDKLTIDFGDVKPDTVTIKTQELLEGSLGYALEEKTIAYQEENGLFSFVHPLKEETDETIIGRLYTINATWGDNDCTYAFIVNPDNLTQ